MENIEIEDKELKSLVQELSQFSSATVHEALGRIGAVDSEIKPIAKGMKVCGPAVTVNNHVGDNIMLHKAIVVAQAGDVIVSNTGSFKHSGAWGDVTSTACMVKKINGFVTDGSVRDSVDIQKIGFSVFSRGLSIKGTVKATLGELNVPISFGGVVVNPGDIVLGDDDGIVIVPKDRIKEAIEKSADREAKEEIMRQKLKAGKTTVELLGLQEILGM